MQIVMLAAGLSVRMGEQNKMLLKCNNMPLVTYSAMEALKYLSSTNERSKLILVTGYEKERVENAVKACADFINEQNKNRSKDSQIVFKTIYNADYNRGQFSSTQTGVSEVQNGEDFFITLADMATLKAEHYKKIEEISKKYSDDKMVYDAIRPFHKGNPGHPVWHRHTLKQPILEAKADCKVNQILKKYRVYEAEMSDPAYTMDIDTPEQFEKFANQAKNAGSRIN